MIRDGLRVGITQRRIAAAEGACARDALDAPWNDWLTSHWPHCQFLAIPNFADPSRAVRYVTDWGIDLLILSGGEDLGTSPVRDAVERALLEHARMVRQPVLGVCRGMQFLHASDGGVLVRRPGHAGQSHALLDLEGGGEPVNSWHHWCINSTVPPWRSLVRAPDGSVEAMQHAHLPWLGLMWHPERAGRVPLAMWQWIENNISTIRREA